MILLNNFEKNFKKIFIFSILILGTSCHLLISNKTTFFTLHEFQYNYPSNKINLFSKISFSQNDPIYIKKNPKFTSLDTQNIEIIHDKKNLELYNIRVTFKKLSHKKLLQLQDNSRILAFFINRIYQGNIFCEFVDNSLLIHIKQSKNILQKLINNLQFEQ